MTLTNLRAAVRFAIFNDSTNTEYSNTDLDRELNIKYRKWLTKALLLSGKWQVRGTYAYIDLLEGIYKYDLDPDILKFTRVEADLTGTGEFKVLKPIDIHNVTESLEDYAPASPEYDLRDGFITIYTSEDIQAVSNGLKLYVAKDLTDLSGTSDEPELAEPFLDILIADTAIPYCQANEMWNKVNDLKNTIRERLPDFEDFYTSRSQDQDVLEFEKKNFT